MLVCCRMFVMESAPVNFYVLVILVFGFCFAIANQSSEIYCGGNYLFYISLDEYII